MNDFPIEYPLPCAYPEDMEARVAVLEQIARTTAATLERLERRLDTLSEQMERRLTAMQEQSDRRFTSMQDKMDNRFDAILREHRADFRWLLGVMITGMVALIGLMARGFHWY